MVKISFGFENEMPKLKIEKPILSEEQLDEMQELIYESYNNKIKLKFGIFKAGDISTIVGIVRLIMNDKKILQLENKIKIPFTSIVWVKRFTDKS